jgi:hypothetical protein
VKTFKNSKIHLCFVVFGVIIGIIGIMHGCAELLQGSTLVESNSIPAMPLNWPNNEFHKVMQGSPVFSILTGIPYFVLGLLAISVSITMIVFSLTYLKNNRNILSLTLFALLSVAIFLFGAGEGTPFAVSFPLIVFGILSILFPKKKERSERNKRNILYAFNVSYFLHIFSWFLFFPGLFVLSFYQEIPQLLFLFDFMIMPISILGAGIFGLLYDKTLERVE